MAKYSDAQLKALARIKFNGLIYYYSDQYPMTHLNTPPGFFIRINAATVRSLERDGLIMVDPDPEKDRDNVWLISPQGEAVLHEHRDYLETAGREAGLIEGRSLLREVELLLKHARPNS